MLRPNQTTISPKKNYINSINPFLKFHPKIDYISPHHFDPHYHIIPHLILKTLVGNHLFYFFLLYSILHWSCTLPFMEYYYTSFIGMKQTRSFFFGFVSTFSTSRRRIFYFIFSWTLEMEKMINIFIWRFVICISCSLYFSSSSSLFHSLFIVSVFLFQVF